MPDWLECGGERAEVYVQPEHSRIVQVRTADIIKSNNYALGHTLRFPRVQRIRDDKLWHQAITDTQFKQIIKDKEDKVNFRKYLLIPLTLAVPNSRS